MVGFRKLKQCSMTLFLFGVAVVTLSYKWFFDQHIQHPLRLPQHLEQLNLPTGMQLPAQHGQTHSAFSLTLHKHSPLPQQDPNKDSEKAYQYQQNPPPKNRNSQSKNNPNLQNQDKSHSRTNHFDSQKDAPQNAKRAKDSDRSKHALKAFPAANEDKPQREKDIAKRIISQKHNTHGKRVLRDEDVFIENRGPDGVTRKVDVRRLHRSFSLAALKSGNVYTTSDSEPGSRVIHVAVFAGRDAFTALMTLVNSVVKNTPSRNVSFHFVTASAKDRITLKDDLAQSPLSHVAYEIIEYPREWSQGKDLLEFAPFRLPELLPYMGGRVIVLDPYCLVTGDISDLAETRIKRGHWAAMATLCNTDPSSTVPEERYRNYLNFSHEAIAKLRLSPDTCVPSPAVMVSDLNVIRLANPRRKMWRWMHQNDKSPVFLKGKKGTVSSKAPYTVVYHNHTSLIKPQWYTRVSEDSSIANSELFLYHWVGKGKPWELSSPVSAIWNPFLIRSTDDSGEPVNGQ